MSGRRRLPSKEAGEQLELVGRYGWKLVGFTGKGHLRLAHPDVAREITISATTSDRKSRRALLALVRRLTPGADVR